MPSLTPARGRSILIVILTPLSFHLLISSWCLLRLNPCISQKTEDFHWENSWLSAYWIIKLSQFSSVQLLSRVDSLQPHELQHTRPPCLSPTPGVYSNSCPSSRWCHPAISSCCPFLLLLPTPPSIKVFSNESTLRMRWPKYWTFSFSISPSNEHPGLISFRMDWLDLLAVQGTLKSLLQHHSSKASILRHSAFF